MKNIALTLPGDTPVKIVTPDGVPSNIQLVGLIRLVIEVLMVVGVILALMFLLYGGLYWMQAGGNKESVEKARKMIIYAIVGLIIMSLSLVIVNVFTTAIGVPNLFNPGP